MNVTAKGMQQQASPMHPVNQSVAGVAVKSEVTKMSGKQLVVLKPGWENGVAHSPKDVASPTNNASRAANSQLVASAVPSAPLRNSNNPIQLGPFGVEPKEGNWVLCRIFLKKRNGSNEEDKDNNIQIQVGNDNHENCRVVRKQKSTRPVFYEFLKKGRADLNVVPSYSSSGSSGVTHVSCNENGSAADDREESSSCNSFPYFRRNHNFFLQNEAMPFFSSD